MFGLVCSPFVSMLIRIEGERPMESQEEPIVTPKERKPFSGALTVNAEPSRRVAEAVRGTLGPKGLDTMLVGDDGGVIVTNDGVTILNRMDIRHPVARMVAGIARAQQEEVGDGTTTATLLTAAFGGRRGKTGGPRSSGVKSDCRNSPRDPVCFGEDAGDGPADLGPRR